MPKKATTKKRPAADMNGKAAPLEFPPGSVEAKLAALGAQVPASEWQKVPIDLFANLDHYLYGAPKTWFPPKRKAKEK